MTDLTPEILNPIKTVGDAATVAEIPGTEGEKHGPRITAGNHGGLSGHSYHVDRYHPKR